MNVLVDIEFSLSLEDMQKLTKAAELQKVEVSKYVHSSIMKTVQKDLKIANRKSNTRAN